MHRYFLATLAASAAFFAVSLPALAAGGPAALSGTVSSQKDGKMEGVVVTARKDGSNVSVSVLSDKAGHYAFPADHLAPGHYNLSIRAVGYDLDGAPAAMVASGKDATVDIMLDPTKNLPAQMTNAEWMMSVPGTEAQKAYLLNCNGCHTLERVMLSTHTAEEWAPTIRRMMHYTFQSQPIKPIPRVDPARGGTPDMYKEPAAYLATINLSSSDNWAYPLKTLPRPSGRDTHVVITEYDLPKPTMQPHDVIVDKQGIAWFTDFGEQKFGRLDPKTGQVTEYPTPELRDGFPVGALDLEKDPYSGNLWMGMMYQPALGEFDPKQKKFVRVLTMPDSMRDMDSQINMVGDTNYKVDGKVWTNDAGNSDIYRIDLKTGKWETFQPMKQIPYKGPLALYGIATDKQNNLYFTEFIKNSIGRIDAKTGKVTIWQTPTPNSRPRRMEFDNKGLLWFAEYGGNAVGMFDPKSEKITEYKIDVPYSAPYYATTDKHGEIWTGGMTTDRVVRMNPKTGAQEEYLVPGDLNIRRTFVDNSTNPVTFWAGANHSAMIVRLEPTD